MHIFVTGSHSSPSRLHPPPPHERRPMQPPCYESRSARRGRRFAVAVERLLLPSCMHPPDKVAVAVVAVVPAAAGPRGTSRCTRNGSGGACGGTSSSLYHRPRGAECYSYYGQQQWRLQQQKLMAMLLLLMTIMVVVSAYGRRVYYYLQRSERRPSERRELWAKMTTGTRLEYTSRVSHLRPDWCGGRCEGRCKVQVDTIS